MLLLFDFLFFDVNVPSKSNKQKKKNVLDLQQCLELTKNSAGFSSFKRQKKSETFFLK
jgi:hypothetical protein